MDVGMDFGWLLDRFWVENQAKINQKSMTNLIDDKMDVEMDVGRLLDRFLVDFGTKLGGKLGSGWH